MLADRIEVVKGPASVLWGPQAMGGVINIIRAPLPTARPGQTTLHGQVATGYRDNTGAWTGLVELEGAAGAFGWRLSGVQRSAGDIETPNGDLDSTDYDQLSADLTLGYTATWGSLRLRTNHWDNEVGLYRPEGFRLDLEDDSVVADGLFPLATGQLTFLLSRQTNTRKALPAEMEPLPAVDLELVTDTGRVGFSHQRIGPWRGKVAVESFKIVNEARALGKLLPDYDSDTFALMAWEEGRFRHCDEGDYERLIISFGVRWDATHLWLPKDTSRDLPDGFGRTYSAVTGSLGLVFRATKTFSLAGSIGRGWRPPSVFELFANGIHGGVSAIQLGNLSLREESNLNSEISGRWQSAHFEATVTAFDNSFDNYIYLANTKELDAPSGLPIFGYRQAGATLAGLEASFEAVPNESLRLGSSFTLLSTENKATGRRLPQTPPDRLDAFARYMPQSPGPLMSPFAQLEAVWTGPGEVSGPDEPFGTPTNSYTLLHLRIGFRLLTGDGVVGIDLSVNNLLDEEYTDFLWPYKGFGASNPGRDVRLTASYSF
jgi:iron complex outermembrane receptor protein/hemoglobin/transferrin/lactoferrin receptor protein